MTSSRSSSLISLRLKDYFKDYSAYHKTAGNKLTHYFGIPFVITSLLGLLGGLPVGLDGLTGSLYFRVDAGTILIVVALLRYFYLDWKISIPFSFIITGLYFLGRALPISLCWGLFISGWILQGMGHAVFEKNSPTFFKNLNHLLMGPLWIFVRCMGY